MTITHAIAVASKKLGTADGYLAVEALLAHVLGVSREYLFSYPEKHIPLFAFFRFTFLFHRLRRGHPLAYLTGHKEFYGMDFTVNKHTLIPRPETELLVEEAVTRALHIPDTTPISVIDIGTGSGAVIVALAKQLSVQQRSNRFTFIATDISRAALRIARRNASRHGVVKDITFLRGNLLAPVLSLVTATHRCIVVANLPYLTSDEMREPSIRHEPASALYGGPEGLAVYRSLLEQISTCLATKAHPFSPIILLEIGSGQGAAITQLVHTILPDFHCEIIKDFCGLDRIASITK